MKKNEGAPERGQNFPADTYLTQGYNQKLWFTIKVNIKTNCAT